MRAWTSSSAARTGSRCAPSAASRAGPRRRTCRRWCSRMARPSPSRIGRSRRLHLAPDREAAFSPATTAAPRSSPDYGSYSLQFAARRGALGRASSWAMPRTARWRTSGSRTCSCPNGGCRRSSCSARASCTSSPRPRSWRRPIAPTRRPTWAAACASISPAASSLRAEYKSHVVFTSRNDNEEVDEWKLGFAFFF